MVGFCTTIIFLSTILAFCTPLWPPVSCTSGTKQPWGIIRGGSGRSGSSSIHSTTDNNNIEDTIQPCVQEPPVWGSISSSYYENDSKEKIQRRGMILMDAFSPYHGQFLARLAREVYGVAVIVVLSDYMTGYFEKMEPENREHWSPMSMPASEDFATWTKRIPCDELVAIYCESDSGLAYAEKLGIALNVSHHNGIMEARRDKYLMNQAAREAGLFVVEQRLCETVQEAREFAQTLLDDCSPSNVNAKGDGKVEAAFDNSNPVGLLGPDSSGETKEKPCCCIVKPIRGVASENVFLCHDIDSVEEAFLKIYGSTVFGSPWEKHQSVLVQEFAYGTEYAIDIVSKNGEHKVAALWCYDKRPVNGAPFVYYATELVDASKSKDGRDVCRYAQEILDSLQIRWGITHSEFILTAEGPRLVEVNCRQHNMDFLPMAVSCIGYTVFDMLLAAYLGDCTGSTTYPPDTETRRLQWDSIPTLPSIRAHGAMVHLVNYARGNLLEVKHLDDIYNLESVFAMEVYEEFETVGTQIFPTVDIRSDAGWVQIMNEDAAAFRQDYQKIVAFMPTMFQVEEGE